jgi:hypothetical protein
MPMLTAEDPRSVDDCDVIAVYPGGSDGSYMFATVMDGRRHRDRGRDSQRCDKLPPAV